MPETQFPRSPYDQVGGLMYFPRMLDKIRLEAAGRLAEAYFSNLGNGLDERCCRFLGVDYTALKARVNAGARDEEALAWCLENGRKPTPDDMIVWNAYMSKRGWRDDGTPRLEHVLSENGYGHRTDIVTFFDFLDLDEGRRP